MTEAYTDGAVVGQGRAGWGMVVCGRVEEQASGTVDTADVMVAELWAVLHAVRAAPRGLPLTVHTDSHSLPQLVAQGSATRTDLTSIARKIRQAAERRGVALTCQWHSRETPEAARAHDLALIGRERGRRPAADDARLWVALAGEGVEVGARLTTPRTTRQRRVSWQGAESLEDVGRVVGLLGERTVRLEIRDEVTGEAVAMVEVEAARLGVVLE